MKCLDNFLDFLRDGTNRILRDQGIFLLLRRILFWVNLLKE